MNQNILKKDIAGTIAGAIAGAMMLCCLLLQVSCNKGADGESDDTETSTTAHDTDSETTSDSNSDSESEVPPQSPTPITLLNNSEEPIYLDGNGGWSQGAVFACVDPDNSPCQMFYPFCELSCEEVEPGTNCIIDCSLMPFVHVILPGERWELEWDGWLRQSNESYCSEGTCFETVPPAAGVYTVTVDAYPAYECWTGVECVVADGEIQGAAVTGEPNILHGTISVPTSGEALNLSVIPQL